MVTCPIVFGITHGLGLFFVYCFFCFLFNIIYFITITLLTYSYIKFFYLLPVSSLPQVLVAVRILAGHCQLLMHSSVQCLRILSLRSLPDSFSFMDDGHSR